MDAPTAPYIVLIESDGTDNDDWITDHAGDPDLITWTNYTEGTEALVFDKIISYTITGSTGIKVNDIASGNSSDVIYGKRGYGIVIQGVMSTLVAQNYVDNFCMAPRKTERTSLKYCYLVILEAANNHVGFIDNNGVQKSYCKVDPISYNVRFMDAQPAKRMVTINLRSCW